MRWVADANFYDQISLRWRPIQSNVSPWETSPEHAPTLITDYEYRIGDERFIGMTALNFDSDTPDYMWNDLTLVDGRHHGLHGDHGAQPELDLRQRRGRGRATGCGDRESTDGSLVILHRPRPGDLA